MDRTHHTGGEEGATVPLGMNPRILGTFYTRTVQSVLTGSITSWCGNCTASGCGQPGASPGSSSRTSHPSRPVPSRFLPPGHLAAEEPVVPAYRPIGLSLHLRVIVVMISMDNPQLIHAQLFYTVFHTCVYLDSFLLK